jgi:hypothetical protein
MNKDRKKPLVEGESLEKTYGCRHSQPDICRDNGLESSCALVRKDNWCSRPPKSWPKLFKVLSEVKSE